MEQIAQEGEVHIMARKPINAIIWVSNTGIKKIEPEEITIQLVGEKAFGLSTLPIKWTLPFFVVSDELFREYVVSEKFNTKDNNWERNIESVAKLCGIDKKDEIIVRSNAYTEGLQERGKYFSDEGSFEKWPELIKKCFDEALKQEQGEKAYMPIIIQKRASVLLRGHVSNERRVAKEMRDWKGEVELGLSTVFSVSLRKWRKKVNVEGYLDSMLVCPNDRNIKEVLTIPCTWATEQRIREHFEWVYDGRYIYIVQADEEKETIGVNPKVLHYGETTPQKIADREFPHCVHLLRAEDIEKYETYAKIHNPLLYQQIGEKTAPLYILDDEIVLDKLLQGVIDQRLEKDLQVLVAHPLIIRTDIATDSKEDRQLLPRTEGIQEVENAKQWLCENYAKVAKEKNKKPIFIMHNYIPAFSSAFAYAKPGERIVKVEALWGLPEGLYYYSHDKYQVDTVKAAIENSLNSNYKVKTIKNYKKYFVCPMKSGCWEVQTLASPYDWDPAIPKEDWVKEIAYVTRKISEVEKKSVSVMWFVGVDKKRYGCDVFPWYHEEFEYDEKRTLPRNKLSFEKTCAIHTTKDLETLMKLSYKGVSNIRNILVQPTDVSILRDRQIIDKVGELAKNLGATILLEGGVLSHAYYQLMRTGAKVEVRNPFEKEKSLEFNKLVRDKIPEKISNNGEEAFTTQLESKILDQLLKRKLVEEALEVLDADNKENLIIEIADILEVLDGIRKQNRISMKSVLEEKKKKRDKAGGFEKGVFLKKTASSYPYKNGKITVENAPIEIKERVSKSTDSRKYSNANESLTRIKIPVTLDKWEISPKVNANNIDIKVTGERSNGTWKIEVSVFEEAEQMSFYDR